jgi:hypothetical protein
LRGPLESARRQNDDDRELIAVWAFVKGAFACHPAQHRRSLGIRLQVEDALLPIESCFSP